MDNSKYLVLKKRLTNVAKEAKMYFPNDKPILREAVNNELDSILKNELFFMLLKEKISQKVHDLWFKWLENHVCNLHNL